MLLLALVPTIMIEFVVLLLLRERRRLVLGSSVVINILTNIPLNLYIVYVDSSVMTIIMGELLVVAVDSFLCNVISFLTGLLLQLLMAYYQLISI